MRDLLSECEAILGPQGVLTGADVSARSAGVWRQEGIAAKAILRPAATAELAGILRLCHSAGQPVVAHGGLTNLVESAVTTERDIAISLERMNAIEEIDPVGRTMTVQAGTPLQAIQDAAQQHELMFPLDLGARGSCTIGGNVSTNAGGNRVIRYGMTRENILGIEAVLADGTVVSSLNKMIKNNAGYDLKHLFIGTEGTLGIVTRLVLRLREAPGSQDTAFVAIDDFKQLTAFLKFMDRELGGTLSAFEVLWQDFYRLVTTAPAKSKPPVSQEHKYFVLVESLGADQIRDSERFQSALEKAMEKGLLADAAVAKSDSERQAMWAIRDDVEQPLRFMPIFTFDVSLQLKYMEDYVAEVRRAIDRQWPDNNTFTFGHLGDGNLHFCVAVGDGGLETRRRVEACLYEPLRDLNGSVSAEHGVGLEKKPYLPWCRSEAEIALMRTLKKALDPRGILNPGKIFDPDTAAAAAAA